MRTNRETLLKVAKHTVGEKTSSGRGILTACLVGSLLRDDYLLGGAADIDLFFVHIDDDFPKREIIPVTDDIHLDIMHYTQKEFSNPRQLRVNPWLGYAIKDALILYDTQHFMDFIQASVRGQFGRTEYAYIRANAFFEKARDTWMKLQVSQPSAKPEFVYEYLDAVNSAANAVASLNGAPIAERRFLYDFSQRMDAAGKKGLFAGVLGLIGGVTIEAEIIQSWLPKWETAYDHFADGQENLDVHPGRKQYYKGSITSLLAREVPETALWPLLRSWSLLVMNAPISSDDYTAWKEAFTFLGLTGDAFHERILGLDTFLDLVEETLDDWAKENGVWIE